MAKKKLHIKTYGCAMNVYDSMQMTDMFYNLGYENSDSIAGSDLVILNTCHIREKAAEKVYSELGRIKKAKEKKKACGENMIIAVAGCVGQAEGDEIFRRAPYVDVVVGPQSYMSLPDLVGKVQRESGHLINLEFEDDKFDKLPKESSQSNICAVLSIQEGCDKFCTFCVVPYTRGAEYSRSVSDIYREAISLVARGAKEITLLGQNVNAYHGESSDGQVWNLGKLIKHIAKIEGLERIRYSTSHPRDMHEDLYDAHRSEPKLMPFLNLPVQSGSDRILNAMNRKHTREFYFRTMERLKQERPDIQFSSDFIIGFPGETEQDFEDTMDLARRVNFTQAYSFCYSPRPGTPGAQMENQVEESVKKERLVRFQALISNQQLEYNQSCVGKTMSVLFEGKGNKQGQIMGKSPYMQSVIVNGSEELIGKIIDVNITQAGPNSLKGELLYNVSK
ncbi:MAG: tRNA (N6-isopentenyl adenosine(37)-C2)-methylthiotransferase MiaB [Alphaproteobacteria bacterium CG11_big_fil_rev_8_21_14_0_20_39_49]|nr:MAG: tRNA (N6-isopentenyl adenosine(37)-C2)-methylthiotransferase MiaB [Alphaproteobacteria bacterium CG11_big_fil_rev_8_21_14_0_20_39_49]